MWFNPVEFTGLDQGRDDGPVLCARIVAREERVLSVEGDGADRSFNGIVVEFDAAIVEDKTEAAPVFGDVFQGLSSWRFTCEACTALHEPKREGIDDGF